MKKRVDYEKRKATVDRIFKIAMSLDDIADAKAMIEVCQWAGRHIETLIISSRHAADKRR